MTSQSQQNVSLHHPPFVHACLPQSYLRGNSLVSKVKAVLDELTDLNEEYRVKNGFVFLICATGLSADAILARLNERLPNDRETEVMRIASERERYIRKKFVYHFANRGNFSRTST